MKVYIKIHRQNGTDTVACCDELLLNQIFIEGKLKVEISDRFFGGDLLSIDKAVELLKKAS